MKSWHRVFPWSPGQQDRFLLSSSLESVSWMGLFYKCHGTRRMGAQLGKCPMARDVRRELWGLLFTQPPLPLVLC